MHYWSTFYLASEWAIRFIMLIYVPQQRTAAATRTWLLLIFLLPWPGLVIYALFGRIRVPRERIEQQMLASQRIVQAQLQQKAHVVCEPELPFYLAHIPGFAARLGDFGTFGGNAVELIRDYAGSIARLVADIDSATDHVHLLTYIFAADATGERVASALICAARRGVQCRVMADAVGSRDGLNRWGADLRRDGVEVIAMLKVGFFRHNAARFDLRNHRKLAVIDGRIGYVGSQNISDPVFVPGHPNEELVARVTGPVVAQIQSVLLADRSIETGATFDFAPLFPELPPTGGSAAQLLPSGPGTSARTLKSFSSRCSTRHGSVWSSPRPISCPTTPSFARCAPPRSVASRSASSSRSMRIRRSPSSRSDPITTTSSPSAPMSISIARVFSTRNT